MVQRLGLVCLSLLLFAGCGHRNSEGPPEEFIDSPVVFGDAEDTSTCFRVRQFTLYFSAAGGRREVEPVWKKIDDATWEYSVTGRVGNANERTVVSRWRFRKEGEFASMVEFDETENGGTPYDPSGGDYMGLTSQIISMMKVLSFQPIKGCPDPTYVHLRKKGA
jgi:hypothetical protein